MLPAAHAPAVPNRLEPSPSDQVIRIPVVLSVAHVPLVSPAIVIVLYSNVFAALIV
jgi:hypothetical protein